MASESDQIQKLYEYSEKLDAAGSNANKHKDWYQGILDATKGPTKAKSLAAQLIPRYFKHFPDLLDNGINALMDLCEEDDLQIRILAVRAFPMICKDTPAALPKAADVLGQLLQTEVQVELDNVKHALMSLLRIDFPAAIRTLFNQITNRDETQRERAIMFLKEKVSALKEELLSDKNVENQKILVDLVKQDVTEDEFRTFMDLLQGLSVFNGEGSKELVEIIAKQADLDSDFKPNDEDSINRLVSCVEIGIPYFKRSPLSARQFFNYFATKVFPVFDQITTEQQTRVLQKLVELCPFSTSDDARQIIPGLYAAFKKNVPSEAEATPDTNLQLAQIECILYLLHYLGPKAPGVMHSQCGIAPVYTGQPSDMVSDTKESKANLEDFLSRLRYLNKRNNDARNETTAALKALQASTDQVKRETTTLLKNATNNIHDLLQPLIASKGKPTFLGTKASMKMYWQSGQKRKEPEKPNASAASSAAKRARANFGAPYVPPGRQPGTVPRGVGAPTRGGAVRGRGGFTRGGRGSARGGRGGRRFRRF